MSAAFADPQMMMATLPQLDEATTDTPAADASAAVPLKERGFVIATTVTVGSGVINGQGVTAGSTTGEVFQDLVRKRKLWLTQDDRLDCAWQCQPKHALVGDFLHKNTDSGVACEPGAPGATAVSGEPSAPDATAASGEQDPEQCSSSTGAETKAAAPGEQDPEQGSPGAETKAAAKNIVLPSFWQALNKILENHDNWISMEREKWKKYGLFAQSDPQVEADASEEFDVLNENLKHLQHLQVLVRHPLI